MSSNIEAQPEMRLSLYNSSLAFLVGVKYCFFDKPIRKLAIIPWLIGTIAYLLIAYFTFRYLHPYLLTLVVSTPEGIGQFILYYLTWLTLLLFLLVATLVSSLIVVMIFAGFFQTAIAEKVLADSLTSSPAQPAGILKQSLYAVKTEFVKALWFIPLAVFCFIIAFIPILMPIAFLLTCLILAIENLDIALELKGLSAKQRIRIYRKNFLPLVVFGANITIIAIIPLIGMLMPPISTAGAAWLVKQSEPS